MLGAVAVIIVPAAIKPAVNFNAFIHVFSPPWIMFL
jgi:hypothetical protein